MYEQLKILQHQHTGRLRPHEFTSYLPLALLVFITGVALLFFSFSATYASPGPDSSSVGLTGIMPATPPKIGANITSPTNGQHFKTSPVTISGTCPDNTLVEIFKNNIFAGSGPCNNGTFSFDVDLLFGQNVITAEDYDALDQAGPPSNQVTIFYDSVLPAASPLSLMDLGGAQLLLDSNAFYRGIFPGQDLNVPITIMGGEPPYAVNVVWGDSSNTIIPRGDNQTFNASHTYQKAGTFSITFQATDNKQRTAFLTVVAIVNGQPSPVNGPASFTKASTNKLLVLWPLYAITATLVVSFWLGEQREKKILSGKLMLQHPRLGPPLSTLSSPNSGNPPVPPQ